MISGSRIVLQQQIQQNGCNKINTAKEDLFGSVEKYLTKNLLKTEKTREHKQFY